VTVREISDDEIRDYIATGEPMDKAGAYAIQGIASRWIPRIEGDYSNVVGLPVALVYGMLKKRGAI
jgi:septum formation protein